MDRRFAMSSMAGCVIGQLTALRWVSAARSGLIAGAEGPAESKSGQRASATLHLLQSHLQQGVARCDAELRIHDAIPAVNQRNALRRQFVADARAICAAGLLRLDAEYVDGSAAVWQVCADGCCRVTSIVPGMTRRESVTDAALQQLGAVCDAVNRGDR